VWLDLVSAYTSGPVPISAFTSALVKGTLFGEGPTGLGACDLLSNFGKRAVGHKASCGLLSDLLSASGDLSLEVVGPECNGDNDSAKPVVEGQWLRAAAHDELHRAEYVAEIQAQHGGDLNVRLKLR